MAECPTQTRDLSVQNRGTVESKLHLTSSQRKTEPAQKQCGRGGGGGWGGVDSGRTAETEIRCGHRKHCSDNTVGLT